MEQEQLAKVVHGLISTVYHIRRTGIEFILEVFFDAGCDFISKRDMEGRSIYDLQALVFRFRKFIDDVPVGHTNHCNRIISDQGSQLLADGKSEIEVERENNT